MKAAIDIGNSRIKCGIFDGRDLKEIFAHESEDLLYNFLNEWEVSSLIISDVRGNQPLLGTLQSNYSSLVMNTALKLPIQNDYQTPHTLGTDRIAAAVGANMLYINQAIIIVDAGTCVTTGIVENNTYKGGSISPGINMRLRALHDYTGKLPLLPKNEYHKIESVGLSTETSIYSGVIGGTLYEVGGRIFNLLNILEPQASKVVVTTGGDGAFLAEQLKSSNFALPVACFFEPNLVLIGLNEILLLNESTTA